MTSAGLSTTERLVAASPIWVRLRDTFTGRRPAGPLVVRLQRRSGSTWEPFAYPHRISASGDLALVNLGRTSDPAGIGSFDVRVAVGCPGMIPETAAGDAFVTTTVAAWAPEAPPRPTEPQLLRFFPGPAYAYPAGLPLLAGRVVDPAGAPVARVRVSASTTVLGTARGEEARTDPAGFFRLPLRWFAGATDVTAALGGLSAVITVSVPAELSITQQITLT